MAQTFLLRQFVARTNDKRYDETTLHKVLNYLPPLPHHNAWLAGGALRRTALGEEPTSDWDIFFKSEEDRVSYEARLAGYPGLKKISSNEHQTLYRGKLSDSDVERDIQLIHFRYYPEGPVQVIESFDYTICQFVTDGTMIWVGDYTLWDLGRKRLAVHQISFPVASMRRLIKYTKQGFYACDGTLRDLLLSAAEPGVDLNVKYVD